MTHEELSQALSKMMTPGQAADDYKSTPLYPHTAAYAREHQELDMYRASKQANIACRDTIEQAILENYENNHLDTGNVLAQVESSFGRDRFGCGMMVSENGKGAMIYVKVYCTVADSDTAAAGDAGVEAVVLAVLRGALHDGVGIFVGWFADADIGGVHHGYRNLSGRDTAGTVGVGGQSVWSAYAGYEADLFDWQFWRLDTGERILRDGKPASDGVGFLV